MGRCKEATITIRAKFYDEDETLHNTTASELEMELARNVEFVISDILTNGNNLSVGTWEAKVIVKERKKG